MFGYKVSPTSQNFSRLSYDLIYNASGTPAFAAQFKRTSVTKDETWDLSMVEEESLWKEDKESEK